MWRRSYTFYQNIAFKRWIRKPITSFSIPIWIKRVCVLLCLGCIVYWFGQSAQWDSVQHFNINFTSITATKMPHLDLNVFVVKPFWNQTPWERLPNLSQMHWPQNLTAALPVGRRLSNGKLSKRKPPSFDPVMSHGQRNVYYTLLRVFAQLMDEHGFTDRYFLAGGTLLGSHRHHDFIPWDDDIDVMVNLSIRPWLRSALGTMKPMYCAKFAERDRFFTKPLPVDQDNDVDVEQSRQSTSYPWPWPFLDITYFDLNETHVKDILPAYGRYYSWPRDVVFPLLYRPFGSNWYSTPRNPVSFLIEIYGRSEDCATHVWSHAFEKPIKSIKLKCRDLGGLYHFVQHRPCLVIGSVNQLNQTMLVEERLVRRLPDGREDVVHTLCLAADKQTAVADTYALDFAH